MATEPSGPWQPETVNSTVTVICLVGVSRENNVRVFCFGLVSLHPSSIIRAPFCDAIGRWTTWSDAFRKQYPCHHLCCQTLYWPVSACKPLTSYPIIRDTWALQFTIALVLRPVVFEHIVWIRLKNRIFENTIIWRSFFFFFFTFVWIETGNGGFLVWKWSETPRGGFGLILPRGWRRDNRRKPTQTW